MQPSCRCGGHPMTGRVARLLLALLTWASLLLCVALVVLWVRSYRARTVVEFWRADGLWEGASGGGGGWVDKEPQRRLDGDTFPARLERLRGQYGDWQRELDRIQIEATDTDLISLKLR